MGAGDLARPVPRGYRIDLSSKTQAVFWGHFSALWGQGGLRKLVGRDRQWGNAGHCSRAANARHRGAFSARQVIWLEKPALSRLDALRQPGEGFF
jgi:hypothetical protein